MLLADHADGLQKKYMRVINLLAHIISKKLLFISNIINFYVAGVILPWASGRAVMLRTEPASCLCPGLPSPAVSSGQRVSIPDATPTLAAAVPAAPLSRAVPCASGITPATPSGVM
ncbi:hypothetical protein A3N62_10325 [Enterobacter kobei]|nr:hypothetical protein A3N62_10325 [Enterobacter kobei]